MKKLLLLFLLLFEAAGSRGQYASVLSNYSPAWNDPYYQLAEERSVGYFLSNEEMAFLKVINLARRNRSLFLNTVLIPFGRKHGFSNGLQQLLTVMNDPAPLQPLTPEQFHTIELRKYSTRNTSNIISSAAEGPDQNIIEFRESYTNSVEAVCMLLSGSGAASIRFREQLFQHNNIVAICIRPDASKGKVVLIKLLNEDIRITLSRKLIRDWDWDQYEDIKIASTIYKSTKSDKLLDRFLSQNQISVQNSINRPYADIDQLKDSLEAEDINFTYISYSHSFQIDSNLIKNKNGKRTWEIDYSFIGGGWLKRTEGKQESPVGFNFFFLGRKTNLNGTESIVFEQIKAEDPVPRFTPEHIGQIPDSFNIETFRSVTLGVPITTVPEMAFSITAPYRSTLEKVAAIYSWVNYNIKYDDRGLETNDAAYTTEATLRKRAGVCSGQANLFLDLCKAAGIKAVYIVGHTGKELASSHAWNAVNIEGKWYLADVTWGLRFFLIDPKQFFQTHYPIENRWTLLPEYKSIKDFKAVQ